MKLKNIVESLRSEAEKVALMKVRGGKIETAELRERSGTLLWLFVMTSPSFPGLIRVEVDAVMGTVVALKYSMRKLDNCGAEKPAGGGLGVDSATL